MLFRSGWAPWPAPAAGPSPPPAAPAGACLQHWTPTVPVILTRVSGPIPPGHWAGPTTVRQRPTSCRTPTASWYLQPPGRPQAPETTRRGVGPLWALGRNCHPRSPRPPHLPPAWSPCSTQPEVAGEHLLQVQRHPTWSPRPRPTRFSGAVTPPRPPPPSETPIPPCETPAQARYIYIRHRVWTLTVWFQSLCS